MLLGLEIKGGPPDEYRIYQVVYPLTRPDVEKCLDFPEVLFETLGEDGRQMFVNYACSQDLLSSAIQTVERGALFPFKGDVSLAELFCGLDTYADTVIMRAQGSQARARSLHFRCICSIYLERREVTQSLLARICVEKEGWDMDRFEAMFGSFDFWFDNLSFLAESPSKLHQIVERNLASNKLIHLPRNSLI